MTKAEEGCVVRCLNEMLAGLDLDAISAAELRAQMPNVLKDCKTADDVKALLGTDQLGNLSEDEACLPQVFHALQHKHGRGVVFKAGKKSLLALGAAQIPNGGAPTRAGRAYSEAVAQIPAGGYLLLQVCMQRTEPAADRKDAEHNKAIIGANGLWVTAYTGESGAEFDNEWLHTIVIDPRKREFFCHNLDEWTSVEHLALDAGHEHGTTGAGYIRAVVRVYTLYRQLPLRKPGPEQQSAAPRKKQKKLDPYAALLPAFACISGSFESNISEISLAFFDSVVRVLHATEADQILGGTQTSSIRM